MKIKLARVLEPRFQEAFSKLLFVTFSEAKEAWLVTKTLIKIEQEIEAFHSLRKNKMQQHGIVGEYPPEAKEAYIKELEAIANEEIELPIDHLLVIPKDCKVKDHNKAFSAVDFMLLKDLVTVED